MFSPSFACFWFICLVLTQGIGFGYFLLVSLHGGQTCFAGMSMPNVIPMHTTVSIGINVRFILCLPKVPVKFSTMQIIFSFFLLLQLPNVVLFFAIVADAKLSNAYDASVDTCCIISLLWASYPNVSAVIAFSSFTSMKALLKWDFICSKCICFVE